MIYPKVCAECAVSFQAKHPKAKYCSRRCQWNSERKRYREYRMAYMKRYYSKNLDYFKNHWQNYYSENRIALIEKAKRYQKEHPEAWRKINLRATAMYRKTEKGKWSKKVYRYLLRNSLAGKIDREAWEEKLSMLSGKCQWCGTSEKITIDHKVPLSKGGTNDIDNLQPLCVHCNTSKGNKDEEKVRHSK